MATQATDMPPPSLYVDLWRVWPVTESGIHLIDNQIGSICW